MKIKLLLPLLLTPGLAIANGTIDSATLAKAEGLLRRTDSSLSSLQSLHAVYTEVDEYPGPYRDLRQTATVTLARPNRVRVEIVRARRVTGTDPWKDSGNNTLDITDGKTAHAVFFHAHSTQVRDAEPLAATKLKEAPLLAGFFGDSTSPSAQLESAEKSGDLEGVEVEGSKVSYTVGPLQRSVEIGSDGLIRRLVVKNSKTGATRTWSLMSVDLNRPASPSTFAYNTPQDALPFPAAERSPGIDPGSSAPDFQVQSVSNKPLSLSEYSGKVVVLEFWATWCWPCNQSIPETSRLVSAYKDRGVESLLVSIKDSRKGFDAWVKKHPQFAQLNFAFDDPIHGQAYEAFKHPVNPTLYVIGRDGRVVAHFEGYTGPNSAVEDAIKSAL